MAKCIFKFRNGETVEIEGRNLKEIMEKFQALLDSKTSTLIDMKIVTPGVISPAFLKSCAEA